MKCIEILKEEQMVYKWVKDIENIGSVELRIDCLRKSIKFDLPSEYHTTFITSNPKYLEIEYDDIEEMNDAFDMVTRVKVDSVYHEDINNMELEFEDKDFELLIMTMLKPYANISCASNGDFTEIIKLFYKNLKETFILKPNPYVNL